MADKDRIRELLKTYVKGSISEREFDELREYLLDNRIDKDLDAFMETLLEEMEEDENLDINSDKIYSRIVSDSQFKFSKRVQQRKQKGKVRVMTLRWLGGAAAMLCIAVTFFLSWRHLTANRQDKHKDIAAGKLPGVVLLLNDGTEIKLAGAENGVVATQGNTKVTLNGSELVYTPTTTGSDDEIAVNTIYVPKGYQYSVVLPDGSKVWLNTATTLTYPVQFNGNKREVEMEGEAYFEVVHNEQKPFVVRSAMQEVEVLGTSFNVSAYKEDTYVKTTLLHGRVKVRRRSFWGAGSSAELKPGQQAIVQQKNHHIEVYAANAADVVSWKDGLFVFNDEEVKEVMKKISRWYDVEVEYRDKMEGKRIGGSIPRFADIDRLMQALQATGLLRYKMEGGKVIIMK